MHTTLNVQNDRSLFYERFPLAGVETPSYTSYSPRCFQQVLKAKMNVFYEFSPKLLRVSKTQQFLKRFVDAILLYMYIYTENTRCWLLLRTLLR